MAVLSDTDRARTQIALLRAGAFGAVTKADLRDALNATDTWIENNQSSYNVAIPQPARNALSLEAKTLLFCYVAMRRAGLLTVAEDS